jgi:uncharacterized protein YndB with AHSA1/START domain
MNDVTTATRSITMEREMRHPPEQVWRALTQGALIAEWLMETDFQATVGYRFRFRGTPQPNWDGIVEGEVLEVVPHKRLSYTWNASGENGTDLRTVVTWTLTPTNGGTHVRMEQTGFRPENEHGYRGASYGWQQLIASLERVLDRAKG